MRVVLLALLAVFVALTALFGLIGVGTNDGQMRAVMALGVLCGGWLSGLVLSHYLR